MAHETFGRLGAQAEGLLSRCAAVATRLAHRQGRLPPRVLRNWRARLDATLALSASMARRGLRLIAIDAFRQPRLKLAAPIP